MWLISVAGNSDSAREDRALHGAAFARHRGRRSIPGAAAPAGQGCGRLSSCTWSSAPTLHPFREPGFRGDPRTVSGETRFVKGMIWSVVRDELNIVPVESRWMWMFILQIFVAKGWLGWGKVLRLLCFSVLDHILYSLWTEQLVKYNFVD